MAKKRPGRNRQGPPPENPEYVEQWARDLIAAVGKRQARTVLEDYLKLSNDPKLAKYDREVAKQRARILSDRM